MWLRQSKNLNLNREREKMNKFEMKDGSFTLFVNDKKRDEKDADWSGTIKLHGVS